MERQAKIDLVIKAIEEAKVLTPKGQQVKVYLSKIINQVRLEELQNILTILEDDEKILTLMRFPRHLLKLPPGYVYTDMLTGEKSSPSTEYFTVEVNKKFDKWCTKYWAADKDSIDIMTREKAERRVLDAMKKAAISQQNLDTLLQYADDDPEGFLDVVQKIGRNQVIDALMKRLIPELTPEDLEQFFNLQPASLASLVRRRKPGWTKTNVPWEIKKVIWQLWAKGDTVVATQRFFELHQGEYEDAPFDRTTITKVREELGGLSNELANILVTELPEVRSLMEEQKPDFREEPK